jgi:transposase
MQLVNIRCCELDVHQRSVVACALLTEPEGSVHREVRTCGAMTADLLARNDWLNGLGVEQVAMESTGVSWRPVYNLLEVDHAIILVNAQHTKAVPGRKTDVKDAEWLADLLRHGLLQASFIPPQPVRELRELTRYRQDLLRERTQEVNRLHKVLEGANSKLGAVATDILGKSGRDMLEALLSGIGDATSLAELARGRLRAKLPLLRQALDGRVQAQHRILIRHALAHIDFLEQQLAQLSAEIEEAAKQMSDAVALLETIPCVGHTAATAIIAEIGVDMTRFPSEEASRFLGWGVPWQPAERWQALRREDHAWRHLAARHPGRGGLVHRAHLQHLSRCSLPSPRTALWQTQGHRRCLSHGARRDLSPAA